MTEKACVIYVSAMAQAAEEVRALLEAQNYMVCLTEAAPDDVAAAQELEAVVTPAIEACLLDASIKIFLIPTGSVPNELVIAAGQASMSKGKGRLVAIYETGATLPQVFEDFANSAVHVGCPNLSDAVLRQDLWLSPDGEPTPEKKPARVKCQ